MSRLVIGTRGSDLAMWQASFIRDRLLGRSPDVQIDLKVIKTKGDRIMDTPLHKMLDKGLFTTEIEDELRTGTIDLAVHSLKDLPTQLADGLMLAEVTIREDPADVLVSKGGVELADLPDGATVFAGSLRRRAQLLHARPDFKVLGIRGNVPTRLRRFHESDTDGMVMAGAGLVRLGLTDDISQRLDPTEFIPACGQGALAIEIRRDAAEIGDLLRPLDDTPARLAVTAERAYLGDLGGGCQAPVGAYARRAEDGGELVIIGVVADLEGKRLLKATAGGAVSDVAGAGALGRALAAKLRDMGCREILDDMLAQAQGKPEQDS